MASSTESSSERVEFRPQQVGSESYQARHSLEMFTEGRSFSGNERFKVWFGDGAGAFEDLSGVSGTDLSLDGRAIVSADFDDDGDVDLFVHNLQRERHVLFRNELGGRFVTGGRFVKVRLRATTGQYEAVGATVEVATPSGRVAQVLSRGAGFASCQVPELVFGLGGAESARVAVLWPGGAREEFGEVRADARVLLVEGAGEAQAFARNAAPLPDPLPAGLKLRIGDRLPPLDLVDRAGETAELDPRALADGKPLYVNFWASYCAPCVGELPDLAQLAADGEARVVLVSVDAPRNRATSEELLAQRAPGLERFYLEEDGEGLEPVLDLLRLPIPTTLVLDAGGVLRSVIRGPLPASPPAD